MLEIRSISKAFPGVAALSGVTVDIRPGEIHALLGENGAGKSTLMRIMCGILQPDSGRMSLDGEPLSLADYHDAIRHRISTVHQEVQVVPLASVAENIMLDKLASFRRGPFLDWSHLMEEARRHMDMVGLNVPARTLADFAADMARMARDPTTREWWKHTDPCQEPLDSRKPGEWWASMEEVFHTQ